MKTERATFDAMISQLDEVRETMERYERQHRQYLDAVHPNNRASAVNLVHFLALRNHDLRDLQTQLVEHGVAQLGDVRGHVAASLQAVRKVLFALAGRRGRAAAEPALSIAEGREQLRVNTRALFGEKAGTADTRIMVTMPAEAAGDPALVASLVEAGMNSARVNCGQDDAGVWERIIGHVRAAGDGAGKCCRVAMDLGGPKIRTGPLGEGPGIVRLKPDRDLLGRVVQHPVVWLGPKAPKVEGEERYTHLPVDAEWALRLHAGDAVTFTDTRGKDCTIHVQETDDRGAWGECEQSAYVTGGIQLTLRREGVPPSDAVTAVGDVEPAEHKLVLRNGDTLVITKDQRLGQPARRDDDGAIVEPARIACTLPEVFTQVRSGDPVSFDDGKMHGVVRRVGDDEMEVEITYARGGAARLKPHKGINFPRSPLRVSGLTAKDRADLPFIVQHGDIVSFSFVNRPDDVDELLAELDALGATDIGLILKIETLSGFHFLPEILLRAMRHYPVGVMLARGDLAVEVGWKYLAQVQEEIMSLCEAAHTPLVWATQVLEGLAKKGMPSRAEIADVVMAERAECVMLNKGPHIVATVQLLDEILRLMEAYQDKRDPLLPSFNMPEDWRNITYVGPGGTRAKPPVGSG